MKNRNKITQINSSFTKIPNRIFKQGLSPVAIVVYTALCSYSEDFNPTLSNIAKTVGIHKNSACRAMKELCDAGVIKKTKQGFVMRNTNSQQANELSQQSEYEFVNPSDWPKIVPLTNSSTKGLDDTVESIN